MRTRILLTVLALAAVVAATVRTPHAQQAAPVGPAAQSFNQAVQLHDGGKSTDAIPLFKQAIAQGFQPINQARFRLARAYARSGQAELALAELETLATAGFTNTAVLPHADLDSLRATARFKAFETRVNANARPCTADPRFHAFDFWIGEWDVQNTNAARAPLGSGASSVIERQLDGCVIQENWMPLGGLGAGKSFNIFNSATNLWEQYYADSRGTITHYKGTFKADGALYFEADQFASPNKLRMTFFNQGAAQVRQLGHISTDGGKTWTVTFDLTYVRKK